MIHQESCVSLTAERLYGDETPQLFTLLIRIKYDLYAALSDVLILQKIESNLQREGLFFSDKSGPVLIC